MSLVVSLALVVIVVLGAVVLVGAVLVPVDSLALAVADDAPVEAIPCATASQNCYYYYHCPRWW